MEIKIKLLTMKLIIHYIGLKVTISSNLNFQNSESISTEEYQNKWVFFFTKK